jgi:hypothetical protein
MRLSYSIDHPLEEAFCKFQSGNLNGKVEPPGCHRYDKQGIGLKRAAQSTGLVKSMPLFIMLQGVVCPSPEISAPSYGAKILLTQNTPLHIVPA